MWEPVLYNTVPDIDAIINILIPSSSNVWKISKLFAWPVAQWAMPVDSATLKNSEYLSRALMAQNFRN